MQIQKDISQIKNDKQSRPSFVDVTKNISGTPYKNPPQTNSGPALFSMTPPRVDRNVPADGNRNKDKNTGGKQERYRVRNNVGGDDSGFRFQKDQLRRMKRKVISGKSTNVNIRGAPPPVWDYFVYRIEKNVTIQSMQDHLKNNSINFTDLDQVSHPDSKFLSFKLSVPAKEGNKVMNETLWPEGIRVRRFRKPKSNIENGDEAWCVNLQLSSF